MAADFSHYARAVRDQEIAGTGPWPRPGSQWVEQLFIGVLVGISRKAKISYGSLAGSAVWGVRDHLPLNPVGKKFRSRQEPA